LSAVVVWANCRSLDYARDDKGKTCGSYLSAVADLSTGGNLRGYVVAVILLIVLVVLTPFTVGTISTRPPQAVTSSAPTIVEVV
jgi:hypothetical protein